MKNSKFNLQDFAGGKVLSREEMRKVQGGLQQSCSCTCAGGGGWTYSNGAQPGTWDIGADLSLNCPNGQGDCTGCTHWQHYIPV